MRGRNYSLYSALHTGGHDSGRVVGNSSLGMSRLTWGCNAFHAPSLVPAARLILSGHRFRSAGQLVMRVSGSVMDCGETVFITNFLPSAETV